MAITSANQLELLQTAEAVAREKMIDPDLVIQAMEESLARAAKSRYGAEMDIRVAIDRKTGRATFTRVRTVVEDDAVENYQAQLTVAQAKQYLSDLVFGKTVILEGDKVDRYGRTVAKVLLNGRDVNLAQIAAGMAWHYKKYEREQSSNDRMLYGAEELDARAARRGLWEDPQPVAPWDWRAEKRMTE